MIYKTIANSSDKDIMDYRIAEVMFNDLGEMVVDEEGQPRHTGQTLEWSIKAGETLEFPAYVADYLMKIYGFLKEEITASTSGVSTSPSISVSEHETPVAKSSVGSVNCPKCGAHFKNTRALGLHYGFKHPEALL